MASPSYTYSLTNGSTADASQVMQNYNDILNGVTDGTKDLSISALTVAGTATLNGNINLGNASADDITVTGSIASTIPIKTDDSFDIGTTSLRLNQVHAHEYYGTQTNDSATAGYIGQIITGSLVRSSATSLVSATAKTVTSISLTAGNWLIFGALGITPGGTTVFSDANISYSLTTNTFPGVDTIAVPTSGEVWISPTLPSTGFAAAWPVPCARIILASTTTVYLVVSMTFSVSTCTAFGSISGIRCR